MGRVRGKGKGRRGRKGGDADRKWQGCVAFPYAELIGQFFLIEAGDMNEDKRSASIFSHSNMDARCDLFLPVSRSASSYQATA